MRKILIAGILTIALLISMRDAYAVECKPTVSWKIDPQFFVGETSKLVATVNNGCDKTFDVKAEVNAERTEGYIKVYKVQAEDETPRPKTHDVGGDSAYAYVSIEKGTKATAIFFIQPDELALPGSYVLFEKFYVDGVLSQSNEIKISVLKSVSVTYQIPVQLQLNKPSSSTLTFNNAGTEIIKSLKICFSAKDDIVSFSELCKTWTNVPSKFTDKFITYINGRIPGEHQNAIQVKIDYTTFTGLDVSSTYYHPTLKIAATQGEKPSLTYTTLKSVDSLTFKIENKGNGIAYDCYIKIISPANCFINSSDIANFTRASILSKPADNSYLIACPDIILPNEKEDVVINFDPAQITAPCSVSGSIYYKDSFGLAQETKIVGFNLVEITTTLPVTPNNNKNYIWVLLIIVVGIAAFVLVYLKVPKVRIFVNEKLHKFIELLSKFLNKILKRKGSEQKE